MTRLGSTQSDALSALDGIDDADMLVHVQVGDQPWTFCGLDIEDSTGYLPPAEVTEAAWCPTCVAIQDGARV